MVICLERGAYLHTAQLMPLPLTVSYFSKIQIGFTFLVLAHLVSPGQRAVKRMCVCVYQAEGWIEDKLKIAKEESFKNVRDIQDKMKSLKKHQAFEAEIMANAERIRAIKQVSLLLGLVSASSVNSTSAPCGLRGVMCP